MIYQFIYAYSRWCQSTDDMNQSSFQDLPSWSPPKPRERPAITDGSRSQPVDHHQPGRGISIDFLEDFHVLTLPKVAKLVVAYGGTAPGGVDASWCWCWFRNIFFKIIFEEPRNLGSSGTKEALGLLHNSWFSKTSNVFVERYDTAMSMDKKDEPKWIDSSRLKVLSQILHKATPVFVRH